MIAEELRDLARTRARLLAHEREEIRHFDGVVACPFHDLRTDHVRLAEVGATLADVDTQIAAVEDRWHALSTEADD